ncbi:hypothetical protein CYMTET_45597, partial [Cymbomonas tetramitiformis]
VNLASRCDLQRTCKSAAQRTIKVSATATQESSDKVQIDWDELSFAFTPTRSMYVATCTADGEWEGSVQPYGDLSISPAAGCLNYGQGVFEGMKAYRSTKGRVVIFRPDQNAARCAQGAARMSMPSFPEDMFVEAVKEVVAANADYVPPTDKGSLYLRPLMLGTGPILGLAPAPSFTFLIYCSPVAAYFKGGQLTPIDLKIEEEFHRAAPGGTGGTKCIGNYSPVLVTQLAAKSDGFADVLYLDAKENKYLEEVSSCNIFVVKGKTIATPPAGGTILPGITRKSVIEIAQSRGYEVEERPVTIEEALEADEIFCTGTAVVTVPVGSLTFRGEKTSFCGGEPGPVTDELYGALTDLQLEKSEDELGWVVEVPGTA